MSVHGDPITSAFDAYDAGDYAEAVRRFERGLRVSPQDSAAWLFLGVSQERMGEYEAAAASFRRAVDLEPDPASKRRSLTYVRLGMVLRELERYEEAEAAYLNGLSSGSGESEKAFVYVFLGVVQSRLGRRGDAARSYLRALELDPAYDEAMFNLAMLIREDKPTEAIKLLRRAIEINPECALAYRELGRRLDCQGNHAEAEHMLLKSLTLFEPGEEKFWAHSYLADLLSCEDRRPAEEAEWGRASAMRPTSPLPRCRMVLLDRQGGRTGSANEHLPPPSQIAPDDSETTYRFIRLLTEKCRYEEAEHFCRILLEVTGGVDPGGWVHLLLGVSCGQLCQDEDAVQAYRRALELNPENRQALFLLAEMLEEDQPHESIRLLRRTVEIAPRYAKAYSYLAELLADQGEDTEADSLSNKAAELMDMPDVPVDDIIQRSHKETTC